MYFFFLSSLLILLLQLGGFYVYADTETAEEGGRIASCFACDIPVSICWYFDTFSGLYWLFCAFMSAQLKLVLIMN